MLSLRDTFSGRFSAQYVCLCVCVCWAAGLQCLSISCFFQVVEGNLQICGLTERGDDIALWFRFESVKNLKWHTAGLHSNSPFTANLWRSNYKCVIVSCFTGKLYEFELVNNDMHEWLFGLCWTADLSSLDLVSHPVKVRANFSLLQPKAGRGDLVDHCSPMSLKHRGWAALNTLASTSMNISPGLRTAHNWARRLNGGFTSYGGWDVWHVTQQIRI